MKRLSMLILLFFIAISATHGQTVKGYAYDDETREVLPGLSVFYKDKTGNVGVTTNLDGYYELAVPAGNVTLIFSYLGYETLSVPLILSSGETRTQDVRMKISSTLMDEVVVSVGRYEQKLSEITVSMEVLKNNDIKKQIPQDLSSVLKTLPGVDVNDRQPTIRGGSGWTYGVGSRCLIMVDGQSVLTPGSGEINWNIIPMENIDQVEVLKGASSVLYGSSALNGLINVRTKRPSLEPSTNIDVYMGIYGNPDNKNYKWWGNDYWKTNNYHVKPLFRSNVLSKMQNPMYTGMDLSHTRRINNMDISAGINYLSDEGYREGNYNERVRLGGNFTYHHPSVRGLNFGLNINYLYNDYTGFFLWRSPDEAYQASPLANMARHSASFYVDPFINYFNEEKNTTHRIKSRFFRQSSNIYTTFTDKSLGDIAGNMGFNYDDLPELINMGQNWQTELLPRFLPYLGELMEGKVEGLMNEVGQLGNRYFPNAKPADYMDLVSWVMGHTPLPSGTEEIIPWFINSGGAKKKTVPESDYTTSYYLDYQFNKKFDYSQFTAGATYEHVFADSRVTGKHRSDNIGLFFQYDHKLFDRLNVSAGVRAEYYRVDEHYREAETKIFGKNVPFKPVMRAGLNYELAEYSFLRASFGQGYRYPSVVEKFVLKDIGGIGAFPNADLKAEKGYNAELGIKQGYKFGNLKGFVDVAGFYTRYKDMIEFRLGLFNNKTFDYVEGIMDLINCISSGDGIGMGAQFVNVGRAEIYGVDLSTTGMYEFNPDTKLTYNLSYVYTNPIDLDNDKRNAEEEANADLLAMRSKSNDSKYLKHRQKHSVKGIFDFEWKRFNIGTNIMWKSKTLAVDYFMADERIKDEKNLMDYMRYMLFGDLHSYWEQNNDGYFTMDLRLGVRLSKNFRFQGTINNLWNSEYSLRPMDVAAPRTFVFQLSANF